MSEPRFPKNPFLDEIREAYVNHDTNLSQEKVDTNLSQPIAEAQVDAMLASMYNPALKAITYETS